MLTLLCVHPILLHFSIKSKGYPYHFSKFITMDNRSQNRQICTKVHFFDWCLFHVNFGVIVFSHDYANQRKSFDFTMFQTGLIKLYKNSFWLNILTLSISWSKKYPYDFQPSGYPQYLFKFDWWKCTVLKYWALDSNNHKGPPSSEHFCISINFDIIRIYKFKVTPL